ncbi:MAG: hypothetical protein M0Z80_03465 [Treponema sp.]|nr:hypothetical protein [Treponema sp.]
MSPVSSVLAPLASSVQTRRSKVPQLRISRRSSLKPVLSSSPAKSSRPSLTPRPPRTRRPRHARPGGAAALDLGGAALRVLVAVPRGVVGPGLRARGSGAVGAEPRVEVGEPLGVDEGLEHPLHLEELVLVLEAADEAQLLDPVRGGEDLVDHPRLVRAPREEDLDQVHELVAREHQALALARAIGFGQLLSQEGEEEARPVGQLPARHEAGQGLLSFRGRAEPGEALGLVEHQLEPQDRHVVADGRLERKQTVPELLVALAVHHALQERDDRQGQLRGFPSRHGRRLPS